MRVTAGAAMMYQLDVPHDERGAPAWWNEEEKDLNILKSSRQWRRHASDYPRMNLKGLPRIDILLDIADFSL